MPTDEDDATILHGLIHRGLLTDAPVSVVDGRELVTAADGELVPLWWDPARASGCRPRRSEPDLVVWHHTAGEGDGYRIHRTLRKRRLSVHFTIDYDGSIIQHADLMTICYHAGSYNDRSVGIEMQNKALAPTSRKFQRVAYRDTVHGKEREMLRFSPAQVGAACDLFLALSMVLGIPPEFPMSMGGDYVRRHRMQRSFLATYRGHLGHMHVSERKIDPVPHIMDDLALRMSTVQA
jgi:hypothetical protein